MSKLVDFIFKTPAWVLGVFGLSTAISILTLTAIITHAYLTGNLGKIFEIEFNSSKIKICSVMPSGEDLWRDTLVVPDAFTEDNCKDFATRISGAGYELGCFINGGVKLGGASIRRDCGW